MAKAVTVQPQPVQVTTQDETRLDKIGEGIAKVKQPAIVIRMGVWANGPGF